MFFAYMRVKKWLIFVVFGHIRFLEKKQFNNTAIASISQNSPSIIVHKYV